jgi:ankyrin repeat protein
MIKTFLKQSITSAALLTLLSSCQTVTQQVAENGKKSQSNKLYGEWINFGGSGGFQIKTIRNDKETNKQYDEWGTLRQHRSSNITIESNNDGSSAIKGTIIGPKAEWNYLAGGNKPEALKWTTTGFDPKQANWKTGKAGFGYDDDDDVTVLDDMLNKYTTVYIRKEFEITKSTDLSRLALAINYDDGFVLYLNGRYVFSINVTNEEGKINVANHEASGIEYFPLAPFTDALKEGKNVIGIEGHNAKLDSSDFTLDPQLLVGGGYTNFVKSNIITKFYDIEGNFTKQEELEDNREGGYMITDGVLRESQSPVDGKVTQPSKGFTNASESGQALLIAAREGNTRKISALLKAGTPVDFTTPGSYTPLAYAAARGHLRAASLLLKNGADINKQARFDKSPLLLVAGSKHLKSAKFLVDRGADIKAIQQHKATCLHEAALWHQPKNLKYFADKGVDPNIVISNGSSPLHWTIWRANPNNEDSINDAKTLIKILLAAGVNKSLKTKDGKTAYDFAKEKGLKEISAVIKP